MSFKYSTEEVARLREHQHFLDGAIHYLRAPLRGIGTCVALLAQKWKDRFDDEAKDLLRSILAGVTNLNDLTKALADYSMALLPKDSAPQRLPVENALQVALAILHPRIVETGAEVHFGTLPRVDADHEQLSLLFRNLLSNALEYRDSAEAPRIAISASKAEDEWRFAVSDNGMGIAARFQRQVFEPFQRLHSDRGGVGLGLAISKMIVRAHGGELWVNSEEGHGSTFFFTLPAAIEGTPA